MYSKLFVFVLSTAAIVSALPSGGQGSQGAGNVWNKTEQKCNVGTLQCCNSIQQAKPQNDQTLGGTLGVALGSIDALVGLNCVPLSVIGLNSNSCNASPACCKGNQMGGAVVVGCNPINVAA